MHAGSTTPQGDKDEPATERHRAGPIHGIEGDGDQNGDGDRGAEARGHGDAVTEPQTDRLTAPLDVETQAPRLPFTVVGVGASAGGLEAYTEFLQGCEPTGHIAFVLIQHLSPKHTSILAELLQQHTTMPVHQVEDGMKVEPDHVYVIRPGFTMTIAGGHLHLGESAAERMNRRPIDDFFKSLAEEQRERAVAVILSGTGSNGTLGCESIKTVGGFCIAEDPATAKFPTMPRSVIDANLADAILQPKEMFAAIRNYAGHPYTTGEDLSPEVVALRERRALGEVLAVLRAQTRHDFTVYKKPTLVRRIQRRMSLLQIATMGEYTRAIRRSPQEVQALSDDLMIHVTGFFRDPEVWESLRERVIEPLVHEKPDASTIRCWVTACSSGEEAYTLGILLLEAAEKVGKHFDIKIFATDTAERSLSQARNGTFPGGIESEIRPDRLSRFFDKEDAHYKVKKQLRELVIFAPQNVLQDPPFSKLDICTCRNLLIYIEGEVQRRILQMLHFGLLETGTLVLGNSETISGAEDLFEPIDKPNRIYRRVGPTRRGTLDFPIPRVPIARLDAAGLSEGDGDDGSGNRSSGLPRVTISQLATRTLLEQYTPAAVVVDRHGQILYFHGHTTTFLMQPSGEPTRDLMVLARDEVRSTVRSALQRAMSENERVHLRDGFIGKGDGRRRVEITAAPLVGGAGTSWYLVSFQSFSDPPIPTDPGSAENFRNAEELTRVRDQLQSTVEELQTSNEEMKASHEEVTSINEELQSTNEELETSKEELQSLNEELTTVNAQLQSKMEEVERSGNDLQSLLSSTDIAVLFLDTQFNIRRFTPAARALIDLIASDVGRPLKDLNWKFEDAHLMEDAQAVLDRLTPIERTLPATDGRHYTRRLLPYRTSDNRIDGVVITFVDTTDRRIAEQKATAAKEFAESIVETLHEPLLVMQPDLTVVRANAAFYSDFQVRPDQTMGRKLYDLGNGQWDIPALRTLLEEVLPHDKVFNDYEVTHTFESLGSRTMLVNGRRLDHVQLILLGIRDVTRERAVDAALRAGQERFKRMSDVEGIGILMFDDTSGDLIDANDAFLKMTGYTREDVQARRLNWKTLTPQEHHAESASQLVKMHETGRIGPYEKEYIRKDGSRSWMVFTGALLPDGTIVEYAFDVTDRRRREDRNGDSAEQFRLLVEGVRDYAMILQNTEGIITSWNVGAERVLGYTEAEALGMPGATIFTREDRAAGAPEAEMAEARANGRAEDERWHLRKDGSRFWGSGVMTALRSPDGSLRSFVKVMRDQTARKEAEEALHRTAAQAEIANRAKDEFLATISHELRTPLSAVLIWTKLLRNPGVSEKDRLEGLNAIEESAESQKRLIDDLLDSSRITSGKLRLEMSDFKLDDLVGSAVDAIEPTAAAKDITVARSFAGNCEIVRSDPDRMRQIVWNLLTNAVKFTNNGGKITVGCQRLDDYDVEIRVTDTGRGIAPEFLPHIFERFSQSDPAMTRTSGGLGLGLAIVKQLVELHGGTITAESEGVDKGATFRVTLPLRAVPARLAKQRRNTEVLVTHPATPIARRFNGKRIFVVEDQPNTRMAIRTLLETAGVAVADVESSAEALRKIPAEQYDLIISDIGLPETDGYELIGIIRERQLAAGQERTPAIALTAFASPEDERAAIAAGFDRYLSKPFAIDALLAVVEELL